MTKISVIVPVYGVEQYIAKCLDSLVNQILKDIEIIVVNDGAKDNSQVIIDEYVKKYPKIIKSFIKENGGQGSARNYGLEKAIGDYIAYVDSDDYIEKDMLKKMYSSAIKNNSDIVICGTNVVDTNYNILKKENAVIYDNELDLLFGKMAVWNKIYKRDLIIDNKFEFRSKVWYEDIDFTIKILFSTDKISYVNECLYNYLLRPGSTMNNSNIERNLELILAFDQIIDYFKKNKKYGKIEDKLELLCIDHMYISAITRIINADANHENKIEIINKFINYVSINFPNFKKNKYLKYLTKNRKLIYNLIKNKKYRIVKIIFKVKK